ncbi:helix-turn-helix domain-containing protein [Streptomyces sp. NPDC050504]|uniref:helix-turn-helix domain-containing protein n=1 Tax=Streptomyces sp. NPDC050504 TaxID=3365618 RepID=UPI00378FC8A1
MAGRPNGGGADGVAGEDLFPELRRIKAASRLSYNRLAGRTHYSRSSWERFLNGKQLPTKVAIEEFAEAAGQAPGPLLALLETASVSRALPGKGPGGAAGCRAPAAAATAERPRWKTADSAPERRFHWDALLRTTAVVVVGGLIGSALTLYSADQATRMRRRRAPRIP